LKAEIDQVYLHTKKKKKTVSKLRCIEKIFKKFGAYQEITMIFYKIKYRNENKWRQGHRYTWITKLGIRIKLYNKKLPYSH
jgi:hypothetical protein